MLLSEVSAALSLSVPAVKKLLDHGWLCCLCVSHSLPWQRKTPVLWAWHICWRGPNPRRSHIRMDQRSTPTSWMSHRRWISDVDKPYFIVIYKMLLLTHTPAAAGLEKKKKVFGEQSTMAPKFKSASDIVPDNKKSSPNSILVNCSIYVLKVTFIFLFRPNKFKQLLDILGNIVSLAENQMRSTSCSYLFNMKLQPAACELWVKAENLESAGLVLPAGKSTQHLSNRLIKLHLTYLFFSNMSKNQSVKTARDDFTGGYVLGARSPLVAMQPPRGKSFQHVCFCVRID